MILSYSSLKAVFCL